MASSFDKFVIAPLNSGLTADAKPWLIPDDAFERLNNAYVFRGIVKNVLEVDILVIILFLLLQNNLIHV